MLSEEQICFALENDKQVDRIPDLSNDTYTMAHHTDRGVYLLVYDSDADVIFRDLSSYVPYRTLAALNAREWPCSYVGGQVALVSDQGNFYTVKRRGGWTDSVSQDKLTGLVRQCGKSTIKRAAAPVDDWLNLFLPKKVTRDLKGYPVINTRWESASDGRVYLITSVAPRHDLIVLKYVHDKVCGKMLHLESFNNDFVPKEVK